MRTNLAQKKTRKPNRAKHRGSASVSVTWDTYDSLDALATAENASIGRIIEGLITEHKKRQELQS